MSASSQRVQNLVNTQRRRLRELRDRSIDLPLRQLEAARRRLVEGDVDVLVLGDSSFISYAPTDVDRILVPDLIARETGGNVVTIAGAGFGARLYSEFLRILATLDARPKAVVAALFIRGCTSNPVMQHPIYGYRRSLGELARIDDASAPIRYIGRGGMRNHPREQAMFEAFPMHTRWGGDSTPGEFVRRLKGAGMPPWPPAVERLRFDYFHGEIVQPGNLGLVNLAELGHRMQEYGVPVVNHWTMPPLERGELHFPGEFASHVYANRNAMEAALLSRAPKLDPMLELPFEDADFEDSQNATEHFSDRGRYKIAAAVAAELRRVQ